MASLCNDRNGNRRILFVDGAGNRKCLRLGKLDKRSAEVVLRHVENLLGSRLAGVAPPKDTAQWLGGISDELRSKLAKAGLVEPVVGASELAGAVKAYLEKQIHIKPASRCATEHALRSLVEYFGPARRIGTITAGEADDFARWLITAGRRRKRCGAPAGLRPATALKRLERVQAFFRDAQRRGLIAKNPFEDVKRPRDNDADRQAYVPVEVVERLIEATPHLEWKLLLSMARYLGVRVPSEPFSMTWDCVNWADRTIRIPSPKTEVHGKAYRVVGIPPPVMPHLERLFEAAPPGTTYIFENLRQRESTKAADRGWWSAVNLRQHLLRLIARIGERPWPRLWHSLRASCQTDLAHRFPLHVVAAFLGNTPKIAVKHYLRVTEADYARLSNEHWSAAQNAAQQVTEPSGILRKLPSQPIPQNIALQQLATPFRSIHPPQVAGTGFEPVTSRL